MKLALIFGPFCLGNGENGFDIGRLWSDSRGLSGSDLGFFRIAQELASRGHEVHLFTFPKPGTEFPVQFCDGVYLHHYDRRDEVVDDSFRAVVSWNEAEPLRIFQSRTGLLRAVSLQINTIIGGPNFDDFVDYWLSPSASHRTMILGPDESNPRTHTVGTWREPAKYTPRPDRWKVVPDGCDIEVPDRLFAQGVVKQPGRVVWTSSPDRGLHWLLMLWPKIKQAVPYANLRIFYRLKPWIDHMLKEQVSEEQDPSILEQIQRATYISEALERLGPEMDIQVHDSVCRWQIAREQAEAQCFPYTCTPPGIWTEGFSVSLMEACASKVCPVTTAVDALPEIYGESVPMVPLPFGEHAEEFGNLVIRALTDPGFHEMTVSRCRALAERYTWSLATDRLIDVIAATD